MTTTDSTQVSLDRPRIADLPDIPAMPSLPAPPRPTPTPLSPNRVALDAPRVPPEVPAPPPFTPGVQTATIVHTAADKPAPTARRKRLALGLAVAGMVATAMAVAFNGLSAAKSAATHPTTPGTGRGEVAVAEKPGTPVNPVAAITPVTAPTPAPAPVVPPQPVQPMPTTVGAGARSPVPPSTLPLGELSNGIKLPGMTPEPTTAGNPTPLIPAVSLPVTHDGLPGVPKPNLDGMTGSNTTTAAQEQVDPSNPMTGGGVTRHTTEQTGFQIPAPQPPKTGSPAPAPAAPDPNAKPVSPAPPPALPLNPAPGTGPTLPTHQPVPATPSSPPPVPMLPPGSGGDGQPPAPGAGSPLQFGPALAPLGTPPVAQPPVPPIAPAQANVAMPPIPTPTPPLPVTPAPTIPATLPPAAAPAPDAFKPVHSPTPTPVKPVLAPPLAPPAENRRTVAEVDLHEAKAGETYSAIAKEHYGDAKYAQALQAHNKSRAIKAGDSVEVPTLAVIRRRSRGAAPAGGATSTSESSPTWSAAPVGRTAPVVAAPSVSVSKTYAVKRDGVSLWDVSEDVYGDRKHSRQIAEANPDLKDRNGKFQRGDELRLPAE